jgi:hypothetical protein
MLHHKRVIAFEQMLIIRNAAKAVHSIVGVPWVMERGQRAIRQLSRASWCPRLLGP